MRSCTVDGSDIRLLNIPPMMLKNPPGPVNNGHKNCRIPEKMVSLPDFWLPSRPQLHVWKRLVSPWQGPTCSLTGTQRSDARRFPSHNTVPKRFNGRSNSMRKNALGRPQTFEPQNWPNDVSMMTIMRHKEQQKRSKYAYDQIYIYIA